METVQRKQPPPPVRPEKNIGFEQIVARLDAHDRPYDRTFLESVYAFTADQHRDQRRKSGEPYVMHPTYVAYILADLKFDEVSVAVGLLHDVLEDTLISREGLEERFGTEITSLVDGVTKIGKQEYVRRDDAQAETFRKMILASARDIRVITVKLADRLHNMLTLEHMTPESRRRIAGETLEIYAPIAHRLGMSKVQGDLEDLSFYYLYPRQFAELSAKIKEKMRGGKGQIHQIRNRLESALRDGSVDANISYRVKRYYSIFRKLRRQGIEISELYDYLAFRVITEDLKDTYAAFGIVHQTWRPIPGRFKDYIAMPKPNLYQSLHTTVLGESGQPFEVQIRTREMDLVAEEGIAAHWSYKENRGNGGDPGFKWLRQLLEWQTETKDPREFMTQLKIDLYPEEVYIFSPKGQVYSFPRGATPLDFAYRIHTDIGHHCSGARVNGRMVPLKTALQNGDIVEILTNPNRWPSRDWLKIVNTSRARSKIRQWLNAERKKEAEEIGRRLLEREAKRNDVSLKRVAACDRMKQVLADEGLSRVEELYQRIGHGKADAIQVLARVLDTGEEGDDSSMSTLRPGALRRAVDRLFPSSSGPVQVRGHDDLMVYLAKCCNPVPGDDLVGYVTRGRGVSVHATNCPNLKGLMVDPDRVIDVEWQRRSGSVYPVTFTIETEDRPGMLARLTDAIAKESNIKSFEAEAVETGRGLIDVVVEVKDRKQLERLRSAILRVAGVLEVSRRGERERGGGTRS
ncbi:MAG: bifunctional (p)ppGpp synthetase/guanosine-3',5'-bis(diphosphate) 3'-pyrophosphohydrolase [Acidobacteriota bacterium]